MQSPDVSQHSEFWSELNTITTFDAGSTQPVDDMTDRGVVVHDVKHVSTSSLLVESLIDQLCKLIETDPVNQKALYQGRKTSATSTQKVPEQKSIPTMDPPEFTEEKFGIKIICNKLHQMKLIDKTYGIEEFGVIRSHYQRELMKFLRVAKSTVVNGDDSQNGLLQYPSPNLELTKSLLHQECSLHSRYSTDYVEVEYLAKGGFGEVYKARNKLDGEEYAVKKIYLCYRNKNCFLRSLREVKLLAKLNHPNIVSYKAAWLEPLNPINRLGHRGNGYRSISPIVRVNSRRGVVHSAVSDEDSGGIVFKDSRSETLAHSVTERTGTADIDMDLSTFSNHQKKLSISIPHNVDRSAAAKSTKGEHISGSTTTKDYGKEDCNETRAVCSSSSSSTSQKKAVCRFEYNEERIINSWNGSFVQHEWATLYIQMQLCESTLRQWLDERNTRSGCADVKQSLAIFRQIVCGVEYIHSQGIVHHDIKPSNIFVNKDVSQVQVGDLGLACFFQHTQDVTLMNQSSCSLDHKGEIGTKLYAAPEQLKGECNPKSDIYSLGIVLFELLQPFSTDMERSKLVTQLKAGNIPPELTAMSPQLIQLIETLVSSDTATRPTARDLLASLDSLSSREPSNDTPAVDDADETIRQLRADISRKVHEIEELKRKVQALELCK